MCMHLNLKHGTHKNLEIKRLRYLRIFEHLKMKFVLARSCAAGGESFRHCASGVPLCPPGVPSARAPSYVSGGLRPLAPRWLPRFSSGRGKRVLPVCYGRATNVAASAGWSLLLGSRLISESAVHSLGEAMQSMPTRHICTPGTCRGATKKPLPSATGHCGSSLDWSRLSPRGACGDSRRMPANHQALAASSRSRMFTLTTAVQ